MARQPGIQNHGDRRAPPRVRPVGVGRRVAGAGGRAVAEELPGAGTRALPGRACSPQRGVAQVSGRRGHGDTGTRGRGDAGTRGGGWTGPAESAFSPGTPAPLPRPFQSGSSTPPKAATFLWHRCQRGAVCPAGLQAARPRQELSLAPCSLCPGHSWPLWA